MDLGVTDSGYHGYCPVFKAEQEVRRLYSTCQAGRKGLDAESSTGKDLSEAKELANIEPQLAQLMNGEGTDAEVEEKMRLAVMELYAQKAEQKNKKE
jgi:hypothetical protein